MQPPDPTPGPAQREAADRADTARALIAASAAAATTALRHVRCLLPAGWHAACHQVLSGALHTIDIDPPTDVVHATAYLIPRTEDGAVTGWWVRVHNRRQRIDFPLYTHGGTRAAVYASVEDAVAAAITALRVEAAPPPTARPQ